MSQRLLPALLALALAPVALAADVKSGEAKLYGDSWSVQDAIAFGDEGYTMVLFSSAPGLAKIAEDGRIGHFDEQEFRSGSSATLVKLMIDPDGNMSCFLTMRDGDSGNHCGLFTEQLKLEQNNAERVAGSFSWSDEDESLDVKFDLPISAQAQN